MKGLWVDASMNEALKRENQKPRVRYYYADVAAVLRLYALLEMGGVDDAHETSVMPSDPST